MKGVEIIILQRLRDNLTYYLLTYMISHILFLTSLSILVVFYPELNTYLKLSIGVIPMYISINAIFFVLRTSLTDEQKEDLHRLLNHTVH